MFSPFFGSATVCAALLAAAPCFAQPLVARYQSRTVSVSGPAGSYSDSATDLGPFVSLISPVNRVSASQDSRVEASIIRINAVGFVYAPVGPFAGWTASSSAEFGFTTSRTRTIRVRAERFYSADLGGPRGGMPVAEVYMTFGPLTLFSLPTDPPPLGTGTDYRFKQARLTLVPEFYGLRARAIGACGPGTDTLQAWSEGSASVVLNTCEGDWNDDGAVGSADLNAYISNWFDDLAWQTPFSDMDGNQVVNSGDLSIFVSLWFAALAGDCN